MRKIHRWLGLAAGIQLLIWTISGFYFSFVPIEEIRGSHLLLEETPAPLLGDFRMISPAVLLERHEGLEGATIRDFQFLTENGRPVYFLKGIRFDVQTGERLGPVTRDEAVRIVQDRTGQKVLGSEFVESVAPGSEYRGGDLPAWKILVEDENAAVYVSASTGRIRAVRNTRWRLYDFLWSLHIMDYIERESFNHTLLVVMASLGVVTVFSGLLLFFVTQRWGRRQVRRIRNP